ncbi:MAG: PAS domain S-box protein [Ignavibacteriales bacterium]|nr:PAS domain S-box protein [Ignavibacteriales bacterium]
MKVIKYIIENFFIWQSTTKNENDSINENEIAKLNPLNLKFQQPYETEYLNHYNKNSVLQINIASSAGAFLFAVFSIFDFLLVPDLFYTFLFVRVGFVGGLIFLTLLAVNNSKNKNLNQPILSFTTFLIGCADIMFIILASPRLDSTYYIGLLLINFWIYTFLKLRFLWATLSGISIFVVYVISSIFILNLDSELLFVSTSYIYASNLAGIFIAYVLEYYSRRDFYQTLMLKKSFEKNKSLSEKINETDKVIDEAENKLLLQSQALESAANGIMIINIHGNIIWCNKAIEKLTGYKLNELYGKTPGILRSGKHDKVFYKNLWSTILKGEVWSGEIINKKKNGKLYYEDMIITPVKENNHNNITHFIAIKQDITSRKKMEDELYENEKRLRSLFENATLGIYRSTPDGNILMANNALIKMLGFNSLEELRKRNINESGYVNPKQRNIYKNTLLENGSIVGFDSEWRKKDGSIIYIRESARIDDESGNIIFEGTVEDITLSKTAEHELLESKERLQIVLDNVYDAIFIHDINGKVIDVNNKVLDLYNISYEEALNISINEISSENMDMKMVAEYWTDIVNTGKTYKFEWKAMRPKDKYLFDVEVFLSKISFGKFQYILANVRDITEQKESATKLIAAKEKAEQSDKFKSEFLAGMSHEIRTPINTILNFVSLIKSDLGENVSEDIASSFEMIDSGSRRLIRTIDSIINMSQLQAGVYDTNPELFSIADDIIQPLLEEFKQAADRKKLDFTITFIPKNSNIIADSYTITQLFVNLIDNAIKYTNSGSINICLEEDSNSFIIKVKDTGIGISEEFLPILFEPFLQEEMGYTRSFEGNGLGLALVKKYIDLNNGEIEVESQKGVGSIFTVKLPKPVEEKLTKLKSKSYSNKI